MESMIEKVARAICLTQWGGYPVERQEREAWPQWAQALKLARAAFEAMRVPTEAMREAYYDQDIVGYGPDPSNHDLVWQAGIDAALKENEERTA